MSISHPVSLSPEALVTSPERFMTLPVRLEHAFIGYDEYVRLDPLQPTHLLDGNLLTQLHHSMRAGRPGAERSNHRLAGAWAQIELAHVRDFRRASAEAQELIALARDQTADCLNLIERRYKDHPEYFDRLYRTILLNVYTDHFAQLGPVRWPERPTEFQRSAYVEIQKNIVNPLLEDIYSKMYPKNVADETDLAILKGLLGELVVLQSLNRIQGGQEYNEWSVAPASMRENCRSVEAADRQDLSTAFDVKVTFADQTFIPIEVKWESFKKVDRYEPSIAFVCVNGNGLSAIDTAQAMSREVEDRRLSRLDINHIQAMHDAVLESAAMVAPHGTSIY